MASKRTAGQSNAPVWRLSWRRIAAIAAAGALLLVAFLAQAGSPVALGSALVVAALLALVAVLVPSGPRSRRPSPAEPSAAPTSPERTAPATGGGETTRTVDRRRAAGPPVLDVPPHRLPNAPPATEPPPVRPAGPRPDRRDEADESLAGPVPDAPFDAAPGLSRAVVAVAQRLAVQAARRLAAPAAAVLVPRERRLVAAGSSGDWARARQLLAEEPGGAPALPGVSSVPAGSDTVPPEFPLDDYFPDLLAHLAAAVPVERWHELSDAPEALLPLVALADRGTGVAMPLQHRRRLAGLWVLARRPHGRLYSDEELRTLEQMAREAGPALAAALFEDE